MTAEPEVLRYSAFAATTDGGNPAGVVLQAVDLDESHMQTIAAEVGYSETAFLGERRSEEPLRYSIRYFSPAGEVPFCGHATVAAAVALAERDGPGSVVFDTPAGAVTLTSVVDGIGTVSVSFTSVTPEVRDLGRDALGRLLDLLGLTAADLDARFPAKEAFAGNWHPVLFLTDHELFRQFRFSPPEVAALMREQGWLGTVTVMYALNDAEFDARNLFPVGRITEDPATGSAAASVGGFLRELGFSGHTIRIHQGSHVGRPSLLTVTIPEAGGIVVTGGATRIADEA